MAEDDLSPADLLKEEMVELLKTDVEKWNTWRKGYTSRHRIRWANLSGVDFSESNLVGADLGGAGLQGANLREADLRGVELARAKLVGADLSVANLASMSLGARDLLRAEASPSSR